MWGGQCLLDGAVALADGHAADDVFRFLLVQLAHVLGDDVSAEAEADAYDFGLRVTLLQVVEHLAVVASVTWNTKLSLLVTFFVGQSLNAHRNWIS